MTTRPVGARIIELLEILEEHGDLTYFELWQYTDISKAQYVSINARRAVKLGLLTASHERPAKFSPVADWRKSPLMPKSRPMLQSVYQPYAKSTFSGVNSIFNMGAR